MTRMQCVNVESEKRKISHKFHEFMLQYECVCVFCALSPSSSSSIFVFSKTQAMVMAI